MTPVTLVMPYYENPSMLVRHYDLIRALPFAIKDLLHVVIVDDGSPKAPAFAPTNDIGVPLQLYRLRKDVRWNQDACRNIGAAHAETAWLLLTDIDHMCPRNTWNSIMTRKHDAAKAYNFARISEPEMQPYKPHPNSWLMTKDLYNKVGGYDERFAGYYGTDGDFRSRLQAIAKVEAFKEPLIRVPRGVTPDASTTTYLRKQPEDTPAIIGIKAQRAKEKDWKPLRGSFEYDRVYP